MSVAADATTLTPKMKRRHIDMLVMAAVIVVLAIILQVRPDQQHIALFGSRWLQVPGLCLSREIFGLDCPACGLTRSIVYLAHGQWADSLRMHRIGWVMAVLIAVQLPYRAMCLYQDRTVLSPAITRMIGLAVIVCLIGNWLLELLLTRL